MGFQSSTNSDSSSLNNAFPTNFRFEWEFSYEALFRRMDAFFRIQTMSMSSFRPAYRIRKTCLAIGLWAPIPFPPTRRTYAVSFGILASLNALAVFSRGSAFPPPDEQMSCLPLPLDRGHCCLLILLLPRFFFFSLYQEPVTLLLPGDLDFS